MPRSHEWGDVMAVVPTADPVLTALRGVSREDREKAALEDITRAENHEFAAAAFREQAEWYEREARRYRTRAVEIVARTHANQQPGDPS